MSKPKFQPSDVIKLKVGDMPSDPSDWGMEPEELTLLLERAERGDYFIVLCLACNDNYFDITHVASGENYDALCDSQFELVLRPNL